MEMESERFIQYWELRALFQHTQKEPKNKLIYKPGYQKKK